MAYTTPATWTAGAVLTAAQLNQQLRDNLNAAFPLGVDAWTSYAPALTASSTNPTLGSGSSATGRYTRVGRLIVGTADIIFGTSGAAAGNGIYRVSLPVAVSTTAEWAVGSGVLLDASAGVPYSVTLQANTAGQYVVLVQNNAYVGQATPLPWTINDQIRICFTYQAAA